MFWQPWMCSPPRVAGPKRGNAPGPLGSQRRLWRSITKRRVIDQVRSAKPSLAVLWRTSSASSLLRMTWNAGSVSPSARATAPR
jgi:hypothetical protein